MATFNALPSQLMGFICTFLQIPEQSRFNQIATVTRASNVAQRVIGTSLEIKKVMEEEVKCFNCARERQQRLDESFCAGCGKFTENMCCWVCGGKPNNTWKVCDSQGVIICDKSFDGEECEKVAEKILRDSSMVFKATETPSKCDCSEEDQQSFRENNAMC